ncbi:MAG: hypothetical protein H0Z24_10155 [Thermosipho sp. (in: Bacteria)]|nr:hypothetical protein [Thermosipho sp. (in: thermotogales)]
MSVKSIYFKRFIMNCEDFVRFGNQLEQQHFSAHFQKGFIIEERTDYSLLGHYIREMPTEVTKFNHQENKIIEDTTFLTILVSFKIDIGRQFLEISSSKDYVSALLVELSKQAKFKFSIMDFYFDFKRVINVLKKKNIFFKVLNIKIKDFLLYDGVKGDCTFTVGDNSLVEKYFYNYLNNIQTFSILLHEVGSNGLRITFHREGAIFLPRKLDALQKERAEEIKDLIVEGVTDDARGTECYW